MSVELKRAQAKRSEAKRKTRKKRANHWIERNWLIREMQREERRKRAEEQKKAVDDDWKTFWDVETERMLLDAKEKRIKWMDNKKDKEAREKLLKNFKTIKREFFQPPTIETKDREAKLGSEAMIALSIIDGKMFDKGILGQELFETFDESGDGYITYDEFRSR